MRCRSKADGVLKYSPQAAQRQRSLYGGVMGSKQTPLTSTRFGGKPYGHAAGKRVFTSRSQSRSRGFYAAALLHAGFDPLPYLSSDPTTGPLSEADRSRELAVGGKPVDRAATEAGHGLNVAKSKKLLFCHVVLRVDAIHLVETRTCGVSFDVLSSLGKREEPL